MGRKSIGLGCLHYGRKEAPWIRKNWKREDRDKFAHLASYEEIVENDYNLNIPRYVDTFEEEEAAPLPDIMADITRTNQTIATKTQELTNLLHQLKGTTPEAQIELEKFLKSLEL